MYINVVSDECNTCTRNKCFSCSVYVHPVGNHLPTRFFERVRFNRPLSIAIPVERMIAVAYLKMQKTMGK